VTLDWNQLRQDLDERMAIAGQQLAGLLMTAVRDPSSAAEGRKGARPLTG
jgi:hypothetical protein